MSELRWSYRPELDDPVLVLVFEGWSDAGEAASSSVKYLIDSWGGAPFADIDPEPFYDFTQARPEVRLEDDDHRIVTWPQNQFWSASTGGRDIVFLLGVEPHLRWRTFCEQVIEVAESTGCRMAITMGALLAEVAHSRPTSVMGTTQDPSLRARLGFPGSRYEGPTGIVGVLHTALTDANVPAASLWAAVPTYVPGAHSPKATLALVDAVAGLLDASVVTTDLEIASASYERQINELVSEDEETQDYVAALEARMDDEDEDFDPGGFIEEVERFLRDRDDS